MANANRSSTHSKKSVRHSTSVTETEATPAPADAPSSTEALSAVVEKGIQALDDLEASLNLNIVVRPNDKAQMRALARVSNAALGLASGIVTAAPTRFPDFAGLPSQANYVETMTPFATRLGEFTSHVRNSILNEQAPAATQTLVLYGVVKGLGRMVDNQTMRDKVELLKAEVAPKRADAPPKQTKAKRSANAAAKRLADRVAKAKAFLAANDPEVGAAPSLATPATGSSSAPEKTATAPTSVTPSAPVTVTAPATPSTQAAN
jgi:hypothetical protein